MKSLKSLTASIVAGVFALAGACAILPACTSTGSDSTLSSVNTKIEAFLGKLATAAATAWVNGGSTAASSAISTAVSNAQTSGDIDSTEASLITTAAPVLVSLIDSLAAQAVASSSTSSATAETATTATAATDSSSKALVVKTRAVVSKDVLASELAAKIKVKLSELIAALKAGKSISPAKA